MEPIALASCEPPQLRAELPDGLEWLEERARSLVRPAACLVVEREVRGASRPAGAKGSSRCGLVDIPASWGLSPHQIENLRHQSPYDGESAWLQLNFAEIPAAVRKPGWPMQGIAWVFIDLSGDWRARAVFDPRPAAEIEWAPEPAGSPAAPVTRWELSQTLPWASEKTLPEIAWDSKPGGLVPLYDDWMWDKYGSVRPAGMQVGGWVHPCQGDSDDRNEDFVCGVDRQEFGDSGAVYLHFSRERGFYAIVECA